MYLTHDTDLTYEQTLCQLEGIVCEYGICDECPALNNK